MNFEYYLTEQLKLHPATQPRDILKQCYQAAYGAEHLLADLDHAFAYLEKEFVSITASSEIPLYEPISPQVCRVNLAVWKYRGLPLAWLFSMFAASANISIDRQQATEQFLSYLDTADTLLRENRLPGSFSVEEWSDALSTYKKSGMTAVHHSDTYRQAEHPAYRILRFEYVRLLPILEAVADHFHRTKIALTPCIPGTSAKCQTGASFVPVSPCIIAIDGRAASGKSTMADQLAKILGADVIRMDDFFLPPALRTPERLQTPGGNVHYERFVEEVLPHLHDLEAFSYRRFDCHIMDYNSARPICACFNNFNHTNSTNEAITPSTHPIRIVEGSYSHHPAFGDYADIRVFSHVAPDKQMARILHRNGIQMAETFRNRWIPMEESYIRECKIDTSSHVTIDSTNLF